MKIEYNVILGCPRSGTTFLMSVLNALPNSECVSGILFPVAIPHIINNNLPADIYKSLAWAFEDSLQNYLDSGIPNSRFAALQKWLEGCMSIQELGQALQHKRVVERIVYKEPFLSFAPEFTYNALPNCRIVHIYRDGRDCANSLVRSYSILTDEKLRDLRTSEMPLGRKYDQLYVPWWVEKGREEEFIASPPYVRAIWMWKEMVKCCNEFFSRPDVIASRRVMLLRYEDLVNEPLKYGEAVVEHLGLKMNQRLQKRLERASSSSIGIHSRRDSQEIEAAEKIAKAELELYGYL